MDRIGMVGSGRSGKIPARIRTDGFMVKTRESKISALRNAGAACPPSRWSGTGWVFTPAVDKITRRG